MSEPGGDPPVQQKWLRLGFVLVLVHYAFLLLVLVLLELNLYLAIAVAVVGGIGGGVVLMVYVLYVH